MQNNVSADRTPLERICRERDWTLARLCRAINRSYTTMHGYWSGKTTMPLDVAIEVARKLEVPVEELAREHVN